MNESKFVKMITESRHCGKVFKCIEECAELIQAINKKHRGRAHNISEEIADVEIYLEQLKIINNCADEVENYKTAKMKRLKERITK